MRIVSLDIKNFRCFSSYSLDCDHNFIVIEGANGIGKSSILESLHYACYFRSFRTSSYRDLLHFDQESFFIKLKIVKDNNLDSNLIEIGSSGTQKQIKIDNKKIKSYKELLDYYRVITATEDDIMLIKGSPENRRAFIDAAIALSQPEYLNILKDYKKSLDQRNALLQSGYIDLISYDIWTERLWDLSRTIVNYRMSFLENLVNQINKICENFFSDSFGNNNISFEYYSKKNLLQVSLSEFLENKNALLNEEKRFKRSLFGAHLDDFMFLLKNKSMQKYASRGQQKIMILLIKISQYILGKPSVFLLDDFITDLDSKNIDILLKLINSLSAQIIVTAPNLDPDIIKQFNKYSPTYINL